MHLQDDPVDVLVGDRGGRAAGDWGLVEVIEDPLRQKLRGDPRVVAEDLEDLLLDEKQIGGTLINLTGWTISTGLTLTG
ncbi:MAG: hypothetical protein V3U30_02900 [Thermoplasmata archaeon]